jgi:DNA-binding response OmpR family regulator
VSVLTPFALPAGAPLPRFTHSAPRSVTLTVELVLHCDRPDDVVAALREFVDGMHRVPAQAPSPAPDAGPPNAVRVHPHERLVLRGGTRVELTRREYDLLLFLARHPRQVFTRTQLLRAVWGTVHSGDRTVDVHVARLRQKVGDALVDTVRGVGYRLDAEADVAVTD